ncbi:MAG TPA: phosphotransferase [Acidobacteriaceae bacterium]
MAIHAPALECTEYRVVLIHPASRTLLAVDGAGELRLPSINVPANTRVVPRLHKVMVTGWGIHGLVLDFLSMEEGSSPCAIVELISENAPSALRAASVEQISESDLSERERALLYALLRGETESPFSRLGWLAEATHWVEQATGATITSMLDIEQFNAGGAFALLRFPMRNGRSYWLKATGWPNAHELPVTLFLSKLCPGHLPEILDVRPAWNAWIMPDKRTSDPMLPAVPAQCLALLECAVTAMAELQVRTIGCNAELLAAGGFDQRVGVLRADSELLFERIREAMSLQTSTKAPRIEGERLVRLHRTFDATCDFVEEMAIPATVLHGDMNAGNVLYDDGHCQFIDWSEAYIGYPLVTLQHLLLLNQPGDVQLKTRWDRTLIDRYRAVMNEVCSQNAMDQGIACMPIIAAASAMYGRGEWLRSSIANNPHRQVYVRTLARHMDQAARDTALLDVVLESRACTG